MNVPRVTRSNGALDVTGRYNNFTYNGSLVDWRTAMDHLDAGFLEGAGGYWYENSTTGEWIPDFFQMFLEGVINASTGGKTVILHFSPGPSFPPILWYPRNATGYNRFLALNWPGPVKLRPTEPSAHVMCTLHTCCPHPLSTPLFTPPFTGEAS